MIPLRDDNPTRRLPVITLGIIVLNVLAFVLWEPTFASGPGAEQRQQTFFFCDAEIPWEISHQTSLGQGGETARQEIATQFGESEGQAASDQRYLAAHCGYKVWWQSVFTAMFLHGGWLHIGGNMLFLWVFGNNVEDKIGRIPYLLFYLFCGVVASAAQILVDPSSPIPNLGASGAIAGVLGAYLVMFPRRRVYSLVPIVFIFTLLPLPAIVVLGFWFVLQFFSGVTTVANHLNGGVAYFAHIGGFAAGLILALLFFPKERIRGSRNEGLFP